MAKPLPSTYPAYFEKYVTLVPEEELQAAFKTQFDIITAFLNGITEEKSTYAYAQNKWTIKEVMQHITDAERIFNYRALCISRKETLSLPGFDENFYAANSNANSRSWQSLVTEFIIVRQSTQLLFDSFNEEMLIRSGVSNNNPATVLSFGFITLGHCYHHKKVIEERYM
ncbi:MAG: DinB family protein [Chitinophagaceae bacterium]|nr:DinB family protein [Chitinophagaceae bacterium]